MYQCSVCEYKSVYKFNVDRHEKAKHLKPNSNVTHQTGSGAERSIQPDSEDHSNLQEESVEQLYENIDQWQKAYDTLKEQYAQVEKVTTCNDGRPSHVSIQLFDKCCKVMYDHINLSRGLQIKKEQQLDRFCTAWEDLKRERDTFGKEINRRDCCGDGYLDERFARKLRRKC